MKEYSRQGDNLIITIPLKTRRYNPYEEMAGGDGDVGEMPSLIGLYEGEYNNGLAHRIDMDYKGKSDQWSDYVYKLDGDRKEFLEMCEELGLDYIDDYSSKE